MGKVLYSDVLKKHEQELEKLGKLRQEAEDSLNEARSERRGPNRIWTSPPGNSRMPKTSCVNRRLPTTRSSKRPRRF